MARREIRLDPILELNDIEFEGNLVAFNIEQSGELLFLFAVRNLDTREVTKNGASFPRSILDSEQNYRAFIGIDGDVRPLCPTFTDKYSFNDIQLLPNGEVLFVCARSLYRDSDDFDRNGRIYSSLGSFKRSILLGDGIERVQVADDGTIWVSYFDEGVYGNFGWNPSIGRSGLVAFDSTGKILYEYKPQFGVDVIGDCYALNVVSKNEVWCYYYSSFPLVKIRDFRAESFWKIPVSGSGCFSILENHALFGGGYNHDYLFQLFKLREFGNVEKLCELIFLQQNGKRLSKCWMASRGGKIFLFKDRNVYSIDIQDFI